MFLDNNILSKVLLAGFFNGLRIGRYLRYDRKQHFHRFQHNSKEQSKITNDRIRQTSSFEEQYLCME